jgi:hypothetical protein
VINAGAGAGAELRKCRCRVQEMQVQELQGITEMLNTGNASAGDTGAGHRVEVINAECMCSAECKCRVEVQIHRVQIQGMQNTEYRVRNYSHRSTGAVQNTEELQSQVQNVRSTQSVEYYAKLQK